MLTQLQAGGQRLQPSGPRRGVCGDLRSTTMVPFVRKNLTVADLGDLLDRPLVAVLATARTDGSFRPSEMCLIRSGDSCSNDTLHQAPLAPRGKTSPTAILEL